MARVAGVAYIKADGRQYDLRGNFTVSPSMVERAMIAGQDSVHGYSEMPRVPFIEGDISLGFDDSRISLVDIEAMTNVTVTAELANGLTYTLQRAVVTAAFSINTRDGLVHVRWEGFNADEF